MLKINFAGSSDFDQVSVGGFSYSDITSSGLEHSFNKPSSNSVKTWLLPSARGAFLKLKRIDNELPTFFGSF